MSLSTVSTLSIPYSKIQYCKPERRNCHRSRSLRTRSTDELEFVGRRRSSPCTDPRLPIDPIGQQCNVSCVHLTFPSQNTFPTIPRKSNWDHRRHRLFRLFSRRITDKFSTRHCTDKHYIFRNLLENTNGDNRNRSVPLYRYWVKEYFPLYYFRKREDSRRRKKKLKQGLVNKLIAITLYSSWKATLCT